jgi:pimeloyl-ACP methyl ester carboxylesterase
MDAAPVELTTADGLTLRGEQWGDGPDWLLLLHDRGADLDAWQPFHPLVAARPDWCALALDLRGHGGSDDPWTDDSCALDVTAAVAFARAHGARFVCAFGVGTGATAALRASGGDDGPDALILCSPAPLDGVDPHELRGQGLSKLFFVGSQDPDAHALTATLRVRSIGQPLVVNFPTAVQGHELLTGPWASQVCDHVASFFDEQRAFAAAA